MKFQKHTNILKFTLVICTIFSKPVVITLLKLLKPKMALSLLGHTV